MFWLIVMPSKPGIFMFSCMTKNFAIGLLAILFTRPDRFFAALQTGVFFQITSAVCLSIWNLLRSFLNYFQNCKYHSGHERVQADAEKMIQSGETSGKQVWTSKWYCINSRELSRLFFEEE
jgi:hypothetical protein